LSGSVGIALRLRGMEHGGKIDVEIELWVTEKLPVPSFKSGVNARSAVNNRLDKLLGRIPGSHRRSGTKGTYQVFVELKNVPMDIEGASRVQDAIVTSIGGIEQWG
ncbi:MAG: serine/threonine protein kinase, partial [Rhodoglobus sp.]|nr:serine/threonine protein kinase [Rhodoglobus sp.]